MHLPPYFLEIAALIFFVGGAIIAWITRWHIAIAPIAACALLFVMQVVLHLVDGGTVSLIEDQSPMLFYAAVSALGLIPALIGASLVRFLRKRSAA